MRIGIVLLGLMVAACGGSVETTPGTTTTSAGGGAGGGGAVLKVVGDFCEADAECASGICLDLATIDQCVGKVCTQLCQTDVDCPAVAEQPDCDSAGDRRLCLYGAWETLYCP